MYKLFTSPNPLSKELKEDLRFRTLKTRYSIKSRRHLALQRYSNNAMLHFALSHNALARRGKVITSKSYRL
jgi:hypothetical protein